MIKLIKEIKFNNLNFWLTSTRTLGVSFYSYPIDAESVQVHEVEQNLIMLLRNRLNNIRLRTQIYGMNIEHNTLNHSRSESLKQINESHYNLVFHFEMKLNLKDLFTINKDDNSKDKILLKLLNEIPIQELEGLIQLENITDIKPFFWDLEQPIVAESSFLDSGYEYIGVIKLLKSHLGFINIYHLMNGIVGLSKPFEIHVNAKKLSKSLVQLKFAQIKKRDEKTNSTSGQTKSENADQALAGIEFKNESYFGFEWHLILRRSNPEQLKFDLKEAYSQLQHLGELHLESVGAYPSFMSTQLGSDFHFGGVFEQIIEKDECLMCYLPLFTMGSRRKESAELNDLAFHRIDGSVDYLNQFNDKNTNANINIIGQSGKGKSVFINRKILADSFDPDTILIIVDVKGSHTRLINSLKGEVMEINLTMPSGINPFEFLKDHRTDEKIIEIVKTFISELCLDDDEKKLNEIDGAIIEEVLIKFLETAKENDFSIDSFYEALPDSFLRKKLIKRFTSKGLLKHIFNSENKKSKNRIRYYNFKNIDTASNPAMSRAIMASIMADTSFSLSTKKRDQKLMFICDETPFFIKSCYRSFSLLSKNMRSLYGSLMLTVQVSRDLMLDDDKSLIDNAATQVILSRDETDEIFKERFSLSEEEMNKIINLSPVVGKYSQFFIKDGIGSRVGNLILTKKEYWQSTTRAIEMSKIEKLQAEFSDLDEDLLITLISENELRRNI